MIEEGISDDIIIVRNNKLLMMVRKLSHIYPIKIQLL